MKKKITALIAVLLLAAGTAFLAFYLGIDPPITNVAGAFASIIIGAAFAAIFRLSNPMYYIIIIFAYFAGSIGSVMNLYRSFGPYDKIIHFLSGVLIAAVAFALVWKVIEKKRISVSQFGKLAGITAVLAILAAGTAAGIWEIMEFTMDIVTSGEMQRGMVDTITDMIAGNLGGIVYGIIAYYRG